MSVESGLRAALTDMVMESYDVGYIDGLKAAKALVAAGGSDVVLVLGAIQDLIDNPPKRESA